MADTSTSPSEWRLMVRGIFTLFWPKANLEPLIDADFRRELSKNIYLAREPRDKQEKQRADYVPVLKERVSLLRNGLALSFVFLLSAIALALLIIVVRGNVSGTGKIWFGGLSIFCFAWSTLARLGRRGTSLGGETVIERLDLMIFWMLYWIGTFAGTFALI